MLNRVSRALYDSRPDLQKHFPDPCGRDRLPFLRWLLTYGVQEYRLSGTLIAPLRAEWETAVSALDNPFQRFWQRSLLSAATGTVSLTTTVRSLYARWQRAKPGSLWPPTRSRQAQKIRYSSLPHSPDAASNAGINIIGYIRSEVGLGESARCSIRAAQAVGLTIATKSLDDMVRFRRQDHSIAIDVGPCPYRVNLFHINADQIEPMVRTVGDSFLRGRYNIGFWAWELEEFPDRWSSAFRFLDEIWTPSHFCRVAIEKKASIPVIRMPHSIQLPLTAPAKRAAFGIPEDAFLFISIFDLLSVYERKNPLGVLTAFRDAFSGCPQAHLLLKINNAQQRPAELEAIREAASGLPVTIVDSTIDRSDVLSIIQMSDCLVSLHRAEGFGLTIAEAMYLGKPVIVSAYSGNLDFTQPGNAFLVECDRSRVPRGCAPYDEGAIWAEPRLDIAAQQMKRIASDPDLRHERANKGREYIHANFSPEVVGAMMLERLRSIGWP